MIEANRIDKSYAAQRVLQDVSFRLHRGERVGLVGRNGSGKSTLVRVLACIEKPDAGVVRLSPRGQVVGYLPQVLDAQGERSVLSEMLNAAPGAEEWEARETLGGLGFSEMALEQPARTLSGGEKTRLSLARLLLQRPDILLLDEPTNHLDLSMLEWLQRWVTSFKGILLVASHDRRFLDETVHRIIELDGGQVTTYSGSYSDYASTKQMQLHAQEERYREQQRQIQSIQEFIRSQLKMAASVQAGPKRGRDHYGQVSRKMARRASAARSRLDQIERIEKPERGNGVSFSFTSSGGGQDLIRADRISKSYGNQSLFAGLDLLIRRGERVGIVGKNGAGKTTLLRLLLGEIEPDEGRVVISPSVIPGYLAQEHEGLRAGFTVLQEVLSAGGGPETQVRTLLACLLFRRDEVFKLVSDLSEGEKVRVAVARILVSGANLLVLDEPTNHLDIATRERMELALESYAGTILVVSHDRYLLDRVTERTLLLQEGNTRMFLGPYSYAAEKSRETARGE